MKPILKKVHHAVLLFAACGWPLLLLDAATGAYEKSTSWANALNTAAFLYILSLPIGLGTLLLDRERRERAMARLCGLKEGDERERSVTGEAARATLLLGLALQTVLLALTLVNVEVSYDPALKAKGEKAGVLSVGLGFSSSEHLDATGWKREEPGAPGAAWRWGGPVIAPSSFPVLALLMLLQLAAFRAFALRRYEGSDA